MTCFHCMTHQILICATTENYIKQLKIKVVFFGKKGRNKINYIDNLKIWLENFILLCYIEKSQFEDILNYCSQTKFGTIIAYFKAIKLRQLHDTVHI